MTEPVSVYFLHYGSLFDPYVLEPLVALVNGLNYSEWWRINTLYTNAQGKSVSPVIQLASGSPSTVKLPYVDDPLTGAPMVRMSGDRDVRHVLRNALRMRRVLPLNNNSIYVVVGSAVRISGACTSWCGYHSHMVMADFHIKYTFIQDAGDCPASCSAPMLNETSAPNGLVSADAMASVLAHELAEIVTNPVWWRRPIQTSSDYDYDYVGGWWDEHGEENADKCSWFFGSVSYQNGKAYNAVLKGRKFLLQQNWDPTNGGGCTSTLNHTDWPAPPAPPAVQELSPAICTTFDEWGYTTCPGVMKASLSTTGTSVVAVSPFPPDAQLVASGGSRWLEPFLYITVRNGYWQTDHCSGSWSSPTSESTSTTSTTDSGVQYPLPIISYPYQNCDSLPITVTLKYTTGADVVYNLSIAFFGDHLSLTGEYWSHFGSNDQLLVFGCSYALCSYPLYYYGYCSYYDYSYGNWGNFSCSSYVAHSKSDATYLSLDPTRKLKDVRVSSSLSSIYDIVVSSAPQLTDWIALPVYPVGIFTNQVILTTASFAIGTPGGLISPYIDLMSFFGYAFSPYGANVSVVLAGVYDDGYEMLWRASTTTLFGVTLPQGMLKLNSTRRLLYLWIGSESMEQAQIYVDPSFGGYVYTSPVARAERTSAEVSKKGSRDFEVERRHIIATLVSSVGLLNGDEEDVVEAPASSNNYSATVFARLLPPTRVPPEVMANRTRLVNGHLPPLRAAPSNFSSGDAFSSYRCRQAWE